jgi:hypothetical protein
MSDADRLHEANRLALRVLEGQARNYAVMRSLLRVLWCLTAVTAGLFIVLVVEVFWR